MRSNTPRAISGAKANYKSHKLIRGLLWSDDWTIRVTQKIFHRQVITSLLICRAFLPIARFERFIDPAMKWPKFCPTLT